MKEIDARRLACPAPVLMTKDTIEKENPALIKVIVDNEASSQNVTRFLESRNFEVSIQCENSEYHVIGKSTNDTASISSTSTFDKPDIDRKKIMIMIATDRIGHGDDELGSKLMVSFLKTLSEMGRDLWRLVFVNSGVKLTVENSEVLQVLKELEDGGLQILVCGTCLNHFNLLDKKKVGETTNMLDIVTALQLSDKVINI